MKTFAWVRDAIDVARLQPIAFDPDHYAGPKLVIEASVVLPEELRNLSLRELAAVYPVGAI